MYDIPVTLTTNPKKKPEDESKLGFGKIFTDHMFIMDYEKGRGWHDARVVPYGPFVMDPACTVFHYAQEIFEGMKCYRRKDGGLNLFRPDDIRGSEGIPPRRRRHPDLPSARQL